MLIDEAMQLVFSINAATQILQDTIFLVVIIEQNQAYRYQIPNRRYLPIRRTPLKCAIVIYLQQLFPYS